MDGDATTGASDAFHPGEARGGHRFQRPIWQMGGGGPPSFVAKGRGVARSSATLDQVRYAARRRHNAYKVQKIRNVAVTDESFRPRLAVEL